MPEGSTTMGLIEQGHVKRSSTERHLHRCRDDGGYIRNRREFINALRLCSEFSWMTCEQPKQYKAGQAKVPFSSQIAKISGATVGGIIVFFEVLHEDI